MKRFALILTVSAISFMGFYLYGQRAERPGNPGEVPPLETYTFTQTAEGYQKNGLAKTVDVAQVSITPNRQVRKTTNLVTRQNGPMVTFEIIEFGPVSTVRTVALPALAIKTTSDNPTEPNLRARKDRQRANHCGIDAPGREILGHMAYPRISETTHKPTAAAACKNCTRQRSVRWEAPDLDCAVIARELFRLNDDGEVVRLRQQRTPMKLERGETIEDVPSADVLATYRELPPEEFSRLYHEHFFGR